VLQCVAVCGSVLQCVAVCCSVLWCVAVCCSVLQVCCKCVASVLQFTLRKSPRLKGVVTLWLVRTLGVAVCCSVLQCGAVCCNVLQRVAVFLAKKPYRVRDDTVVGFHFCPLSGCGIVLQYVAVCCSVLQYIAVCCSVLQWGAVCCSVLQFFFIRTLSAAGIIHMCVMTHSHCDMVRRSALNFVCNCLHV